MLLLSWFSRRGLPVGGKNGFALVVLLIVVALTTLPRTSATAAVEEKECLTDGADAANSCSPPTTTTVHSDHADFDEYSLKQGIKFLKNKVFGQRINEDEEPPFSYLGGQAAANSEEEDDEHKKEVATEKSLLSKLNSMLRSDSPEEELLQFVLTSDKEKKDADGTTYFDMKLIFKEHVKEAMNQVARVMGDLIGDNFKELCGIHDIPAWAYYLRRDEELKNASWKRHQHQYFKKLEGGKAHLQELNKALHLSTLAYLDTEKEILEGLKTVDGNAWELFYCDIQGDPMEPAHFLAIRKLAGQIQTKTNTKEQTEKNQSWWRGRNKVEQEEQVLEVVLVVRGTKVFGDVLSDLLFESVDYRGYKAHGGIMKSGQYIVEKHLERLRVLLEASGRSKLKLGIFGHSLGAGTAAIAAMEFNDHASDSFNIDVFCVGFGGPSSVSPELSEKYKDLITTVVSDADVVPRFSASSLANLKLKTMQFDWTGMIAEGLDTYLEDLTKDLTFGKEFIQAQKERVKLFREERFVSYVIPKIKYAAEKIAEVLPNGIPMDIIPPGTCIHMYRNGVGYDARYTPCSFFAEIEFVPHCVDDHMIKTGYQWALLSLLRQEEGDPNAVFPKYE